MGEPLKGKGILQIKETLPNFTSFAGAMANAGRKVKKLTGKVVYYERDIKSAVEWLKEEISSLPEDISAKQFKIQLWHIIPQAFPDLNTKNSKKEKKE